MAVWLAVKRGTLIMWSDQELQGDIALMPLDQAAEGEKGNAISSKHCILIVFIATICQIDMLRFYKKGMYKNMPWPPLI